MIAILFVIAAEAVSPSSSVTAKADEDKIQCRVEYQVYSRIPDRICRRHSDWARIEKQNAEDLASSRNDRSSGRSGTIVNSAEGGVVSTNSNFPGSSRPPR